MTSNKYSNLYQLAAKRVSDISKFILAIFLLIIFQNFAYAQNNSKFRSVSVPLAMYQDQPYKATVGFYNSGTTTWTAAGGYVASSINGYLWGTPNVPVPAGVTVPPGSWYLFEIPVVPQLLGTYPFTWQMRQGDNDWFGDLSQASEATAPVVVVTRKPLTTSNASFISHSIPSTMAAGQTYAVSVTMENTGPTAWSTSKYRVGLPNPAADTAWQSPKLYPSISVNPGEKYTFNFNLTAPSKLGGYILQWQMAQIGVAWFGEKSPNIPITISASLPNSASFVSQNMPSSMNTGQTYTASVTMKNTGTNTWTAAGLYRLGSQNPQDNTSWAGTNRVILNTSVAPGQQYTFTFPAKAPAVPGTHNFQWQMVQDGVEWFGEKSTNTAVSVAMPEPRNAAFVSQVVPSSMVAGQAYSASVTMKNTGADTWTEGSMYRLGSQIPNSASIWGADRAYLTKAVAPGEQYTFTFPIKAPPTAGSYNFQWRMLQENVVWFGDASTNTPVSVTASASNNAAFVSQSLPVSTMTAGQTYTVAVTMQNTGTTAWTATEAYKLGAQNPQDPINTRWNSTGRVPVGTSVALGQQYKFTFPVTAPTTPGTYNFQWKMLRENVEWFGALSSNVAIPVVAAGTNVETITFFHNDVSGSPMLATDSSGNLLWNESYLPYGERLNDNLDSNNRLWFTGKPYDNDSGLSYMGARYYNPVLGRFMGVDPKGFDTDNLHSFNRYAYANNNPYKYVDPDGRTALQAVIAAGAVFITAQAVHTYSTNPKAKAAAERIINWFGSLIYNESAEPPKADSDAKPSPGLKGDPYSPEEVDRRRSQNEEQYGKGVGEKASDLGYKNRVKDPPFNPHGQPVYTNGNDYITPDVDKHKGGEWKIFDRHGNRVGTFDGNLNPISK